MEQVEGFYSEILKSQIFEEQGKLDSAKYYAKKAFRNNLFIFIVVRLGGWPQRKKAHVQF